MRANNSCANSGWSAKSFKKFSVPRKIVIAGGVSQIGEPILAPIRRTIRERVYVMPVEQVEVIQAQLGDDAGVIGAALWAADYFN